MKAFAMLLENLAASCFSAFNQMLPTTSRYAVAVSGLNSGRFSLLFELGRVLVAGSYKSIFCSAKEVKKVREF